MLPLVRMLDFLALWSQDRCFHSLLTDNHCSFLVFQVLEERDSLDDILSSRGRLGPEAWQTLLFLLSKCMLSLSRCSLNGLVVLTAVVTNVVWPYTCLIEVLSIRSHKSGRHSFNYLTVVVYYWENQMIYLCLHGCVLCWLGNESVGDAVTGILFPKNTSNHSWRTWCNAKCWDQAAGGWQTRRLACLNRAFQHAHNSATHHIDCTGHQRSRVDIL